MQLKRVLLGVEFRTNIVLCHYEVVECEIVSFDWVLGDSVNINFCDFCLPSGHDCNALKRVRIMTFYVASYDLDMDREVTKNFDRIVSKLHA